MSAIPEAKAASRIASALGTYLSPQWLTSQCLEAVASKIVANRLVIRECLDELDADPEAIGDRGKVLRQQATSSLSDEDHILERLHHLKAEESYLNACLTAMGSVYARDYDPDARDQDREDALAREASQDEAGAQNAPRVAAS